jgi:hypothetical protein
MICFLVAGAVFVLFGGFGSGSGKRERGKPPRRAPEGSEKTTKENRSGRKRAAS